MKNRILLTMGCFLFTSLIFAQSPGNFDKYFLDKTMRVDYVHIGHAKEEMVSLDQVYQQGGWAGSNKNLIDRFDVGRYCVKVYDSGSGTLIFSKGFDSYFGEYQTTEAAGRGMRRAYHESALIPYPKSKVKFAIESRDRQNLSHPVFSGEIDPASITGLKKPLSSGVKVFELVKSGDPQSRPGAICPSPFQTRAVQKPEKSIQHLRRLQALRRQRLRRAEPRQLQEHGRQCHVR
jgi:hypothetical protein